ncbi:transcription antitermination factor NusB [Adhaeribacter rhizoryzae]|uniref:Transcription antitermination factor NusB n=1 Tax=Adhaeribacter rhizoryzae TaxID=2607907 RepID=A0A5M6D9E4_9BACT|nr:transcription antitermination factor NusB [Adhaeribacter rhizoryzae]KAA5544151.1 transcription antitermination factor NusB [Adhaeribacter rhizoryzae]
MLNRRTLRIKAMQAIYAYQQAEGSDYLMALDRIEDQFAPDLMSMEPQDRKKLQGQKEIAAISFKEWYETRRFDNDETDPEIKAAVNQAVVFYQNQLKKDFKYFGNQMLQAVEKIYDHYLGTLQIMDVFIKLIGEEQQRRSNRYTETTEKSAEPFLHNKVLQKLLANKSYQNYIVRRNIKWGEGDLDVIRQLYKTVLRKDEAFLNYISGGAHTYEEDHQLIKHIFKNIIFKDKNLQSLFEERDMNWEENRVIVKNLVNKTVKLLDEESDENLMLLDLSSNWEDDRAFFEELYHKTLEEDTHYEALIMSHIQNWDVERVALIDKIILKMALCEMHIFRSIPVKVTINEYIEISKLYSTPKSKQFINGVLDKLAQELTENGTIRKSGRGLIDNK